MSRSRDYKIRLKHSFKIPTNDSQKKKKKKKTLLAISKLILMELFLK